MIKLSLRKDTGEYEVLFFCCVQVGGGESYTIGLRFAPSHSPGSLEILVFVNNLEERTEETFCLRVSYS